MTPFPILEPGDDAFPAGAASAPGSSTAPESPPQADSGPEAATPEVPGRAAPLPEDPFAVPALAAAAERIAEMSAELLALKPWQMARRAALAGQLREISGFLKDLISGRDPGPDSKGGTT